MIRERWPLRAAFRLSAPALDRLADRVESGEAPRFPAWAGLYRIRGTKRTPRGDTASIVGSDSKGDSAFSGKPGSSGTGDQPLSGGWYLWDED